MDSTSPLQGAVPPESDTAERQGAEERLRYRAAQFETLVNQAPLGIYLVDADFRIAQVNPVALPVFGDIAGGVIGRDFDEIIHRLWQQQYADEIVRIFRHTLETGDSYVTPERAEYRIDRKKAEYYEWRVDRITLPDGRYGLVCYFRDISPQVEAHTQIERAASAQAMLAALVASSDDAIISKDLNGIITSWNRGAERIFGYTAEEAIGQPVTMLMPADRVDEEPGILARIRQGESVDHYDALRRRKDGLLLDISLTVSPITDAQGRIVGASKIARDVTARKRAEEALRESEQRLGGILRQATVGIAQTDLTGRFVLVNDRYCEMVGRSREELLGLRMQDITHPADRPVNEAQLRRLVESGRDFSIEKRYVWPDGSDVWVNSNVYLVRDAAGRPEYAVAVSLDITYRKHLEDAARRREEQYGTLVSILTDVPWTADADGRFVTPQSAWYTYTGQSWEEHRDFGWANALHPEDRDQVRAAWKHAVATGAAFESRGRLWHAPSQQYRHVVARAAPVRDANGAVQEWIGAVTDIHDRQQAEDALRRSEAKFRALFDHSPLPKWAFEVETLRFVDVNEAALEHYGYSRDEFLQMTVLDVRTPLCRRAGRAA